jgi:hypothetical protein
MERSRSLLGSAVLVTLALAAGASPSAAGSIGETAAAFKSPSLGGGGVDAAGRKLRFGHLQLEVTSGRLYPVLAGKDLAGVFFVGEGRFRYSSNDPLEAPSFKTNVGRNTGYSVGAEGGISDEVSRFLLFVSSGAEELAGPEATAGEAPQGARDALKDHLARFEKDQGTRPAQLMPQARLEAPADRVVLAEIEARKEDLLYVYDTLRNVDESIASLRKVITQTSFYKGFRVPDLLSAQPIGRTRLDRAPRRFLLSAVDVALVNPDAMKAELEVKETFEALASIRTLELTLWSRRVGTFGVIPKLMQNDYTLKSVTLEGGGAVPFSHVDGDLVVELPRPLAAGEKVQLDFRVGGDVLFRPGGDNYWELPTASWLPVPERLDLQAFRYHAVVKVKKPFIAFSDGQTLKRWDEGDLACAEFLEEKPINIPVVIAGKYTTVSETRAGVTVNSSAYGMSKDMAGKKLINIVFSLLDFYGQYLGPFPFKELNIVEINSYGFGQAPAGVIRITKEAFDPLGDTLLNLFSENINQRVAHELAHTWWGHVAKLGDRNDEWMSESLAQYYSVCALEKVWDKSKFEVGVKDWKRRSDGVGKHGTLYLANLLSGSDGFRDRSGLVYGKGPIVLHAFRQEVGDHTFFTIFKSYLKNFDFKHASTKSFLAITNFITKKDYGPWFEKYVFGTEWPK